MRPPPPPGSYNGKPNFNLQAASTLPPNSMPSASQRAAQQQQQTQFQTPMSMGAPRPSPNHGQGMMARPPPGPAPNGLNTGTPPPPHSMQHQPGPPHSMPQQHQGPPQPMYQQSGSGTPQSMHQQPGTPQSMHQQPGTPQTMHRQPGPPQSMLQQHPGPPMHHQQPGPPMHQQQPGPPMHHQQPGPPMHQPQQSMHQPPQQMHQQQPPPGPPMAMGSRMTPQQVGQAVPRMSSAYGAPPPPQASSHPPSYGNPQQQPQQHHPPQPVTAPIPPGQRIDPGQIPRPPVLSNVVRYYARGHTMTLPPPASSHYIAFDDGCCSPRFCRPTLNHVPATAELATQCALPLALCLTPLAVLEPEETPVPTVDFGDDGPLRCTRCYAYISCFAAFVSGGRKYVCSICRMVNEVPREYYCAVDEHGRRRDVLQRAELSKGSVDFIVPPSYAIRPPQRQIFCFCFDVSQVALQSGFIHASLAAFKEALEKFPEPEASLVGLMTFDASVQYYTMSKDETPAVLVCSDISDPFAPLPADKWLLPVQTMRPAIDALCDLILAAASDATCLNTAPISALSSAVASLTETGGRLSLFHMAGVKLGVGAPLRSEQTSVYGTEKEETLYTPLVSDVYTNLVTECCKSQIIVDIWCAGQLYQDLATLSTLSVSTGGTCTSAPYFGKHPEEDAAQLSREVQRAVDSTQGAEAVLKVRVSSGLRVKATYGHYHTRGDRAEIEMCGVDVSKAFVATLEHEEDLTEGQDVHIQAALLYTNIHGIRMVRVHNLALQVAPLLSNVFRYADLEATCAVYQRQAAEWMRSETAMVTREKLLTNCVTVLTNYRKFCAANSSNGQLILPESLKLLPLYTLATLKSPGIRSNLSSGARGLVDVRADERVLVLNQFHCMPVEHAVACVYPKLYALHALTPDVATVNEAGKFIFPPLLPPTAAHLTEDGVFLLVTTMSMQLYISPQVSPELLMALFGTSTVDSSERPVSFCEESTSEIKYQIEALVDEIRTLSPVVQPLEMITKKDWRCNRFMNTLIEDRTKNDMSYVEFLCQVHKKIQARLN